MGSLCLVVWVCLLLFYSLSLTYRLQGGTRIIYIYAPTPAMICAPTQPVCLAVWVCHLLF